MNQSAERQLLEQDAIIDMLFIEKDGSAIYITKARNLATPLLRWNGIDLTPVDFETSGFEARADDELPRPTIKVNAVEPTVFAFLKSIDWGRGATVTRQRTYLKHLDGQSEPDSSQIFGKEQYVVSKAQRTFPEINWELRSFLDGVIQDFPTITLTRTYCDFIYRRWTGSTFEMKTCPYSGTNKFKLDNTPTTVNSEDACSKSLLGCRARYGNGPLPFRGTLGGQP